MKAFITGATGFLGTHLVQAMEKEGWEMVVLHRPTSDLRELEGRKGVSFAEGDITDITSLRRGMPEAVDVVFHLAGSAGTIPHSQEQLRYTVNLDGTRNVVQVCMEKQIGRLVHTSTVFRSSIVADLNLPLG